MPRIALLALLLLAVFAGPAAAAPQSVSIAGFAFTPGTVTVNAGEAVTWTFTGPDTNHSVTSSPTGQGESFDSDPGRFPESADHPVGTRFAHTFTKPGGYTYFCKVHPSMRGTVKVNNADGSTDNANPEITKVRVRPGRLSFRVDELTDIVVRVRRLGSRRVLKTINASNRAGNVSLGLPRLRRGNYRATIRATDKSGIDNSREVNVRFTVK